MRKVIIIALVIILAGCKKESPEQVVEIFAMNHDVTVTGHYDVEGKNGGIVNNILRNIKSGQSWKFTDEAGQSTTLKLESYNDIDTLIDNRYTKFRIYHDDFNCKVTVNGKTVHDKVGRIHEFKF